MDLNFLPLVLWLKTRLCTQQKDQESFYILNYAISFWTKHKTRIYISSSYKIIINSTEVYLGIKRS
jgi:hypothetical protein